jgi:hypothetical protein
MTTRIAVRGSDDSLIPVQVISSACSETVVAYTSTGFGSTIFAAMMEIS